MTQLFLTLQKLDEQALAWLARALDGREWLAAASVLAGEFGLYMALALWGFFWLLAQAPSEKRSHRISLASALLSALVARFGIKELIVALWSRPRPFETLGINPLFPEDPGGAFPSGHATMLFALATGIWMHNRKMGVLFGILALLISAGRVLARVHWPGDIVAGFIIGSATALILTPLFKRFFERVLT